MTLNQWIQAHGLTNCGFARMLEGELSRSQVSRIRRGRSRPRVATTRLLEAATGIPAATLILGDEP